MTAELRSGAATSLGGAPDVMYWVPGRIEFLGKHTDYAGGRSLLCAMNRGIMVAARARDDDRITVRDVGRDLVVEARLDPTLRPRERHWGLYADVVARRLAANFGPELHGADVAMESNLPVAAGMSSSSALVVGLTLAVAACNRLDGRARWRDAFPDPDALASYLSCVENGLSFGPLAGDRGVGARNGSEDHVAILRSRPGALVQYRFSPVCFEEEVCLPDDHVFALASCGVRAEKTGDAMELYNAIARRTDSARLEQLHLESELLIPMAAAALRDGDLRALGAAVDRSQRAAETHLRNQIPETVYLARAARALGAVAASAFGAGFGGSVWALVPAAASEAFSNDWREDYVTSFPQHAADAEFFLTRASVAATRLA